MSDAHGPQGSSWVLTLTRTQLCGQRLIDELSAPIVRLFTSRAATGHYPPDDDSLIPGLFLGIIRRGNVTPSVSTCASSTTWCCTTLLCPNSRSQPWEPDSFCYRRQPAKCPVSEPSNIQTGEVWPFQVPQTCLHEIRRLFPLQKSCRVGDRTPVWSQEIVQSQAWRKNLCLAFEFAWKCLDRSSSFLCWSSDATKRQSFCSVHNELVIQCQKDKTVKTLIEFPHI